MKFGVTIWSMKNGKVEDGRASSYGSTITTKIYIKDNILDVLHFERNNDWDWNNNGFDRTYHPKVKEAEVRKIINMLSEYKDDKRALFYQTAIALFEAAEDKGNP